MLNFQAIKETVPISDAAQRYGLTIKNGGMTVCPFHPDHNPSMKLYKDHFHCFGCHTHGDVIDLTSKLLGLDLVSAQLRRRVKEGEANG